jgi:hypothetical protein
MAGEILRGFFMIPSGVIVASGSFLKLDQYLRPTGTSDYPLAHTTYEFRRGMQMPDDILEIVLTQLHEESHYRQLMSTPMGLMLWRALNALTVGVNFLARHVTGLRPSLRPEGALDDWLAGGGLGQFNDALLSGAAVEQRMMPSRRHQGAGLVSYMQQLLDEIDVVKRFLSGVLDRTEMSVGEFIELANAAFTVMCRRSDLKTGAVWSTNLPSDTPLLSVDRFAGNEIIEAAARLEEHWLLGLIGVGPAAFEEWRKARIFGVYQPAYEYLLNELKDVAVARSVIDVALMTPVDPAFTAASGGTMLVEEVLPSFRLPRVVESAMNSFWPRDPEKRGALLARHLAASAHLTTPERVAEVGAEASYSGEHSWDYDERQFSREPQLGKTYNVAQEDVRRAMKKRLANPSSILMREDEPDPIRPLLTFFDDVPLLSGASFKEGSLLNVVNSYQKFIIDGLHLALLSLFDTDILLRCERAILERVTGDGKVTGDPLSAFSVLEEEKRRHIFGVREIAQRVISEEHLYLLNL